MFNGQPKGLYALALANTGERFGYYTMLAVFTLFIKDNFGFNEGTAGLIYSTFLMLVYFLPLFGAAICSLPFRSEAEPQPSWPWERHCFLSASAPHCLKATCK